MWCVQIMVLGHAMHVLRELYIRDGCRVVTYWLATHKAFVVYVGDRIVLMVLEDWALILPSFRFQTKRDN